MAMNKNLKAGDLLFTFHTASYSEREHRSGREKYQLHFKTLHIHNRRERTTGANVPREFAPILNKLGIRTEDHGYSTVVAVGCRSATYLRERSNSPYPSVEMTNKASRTFAGLLENGMAHCEGLFIKESDFVSEFKQNKISNKDCLFALQKPLEEFLSNETHSE